jgi:hypothetical protein
MAPQVLQAGSGLGTGWSQIHEGQSAVAHNNQTSVLSQMTLEAAYPSL